MKICKQLALLAFLALFAVGQAVAAANGNGNGNGNGNSNGNGNGKNDDKGGGKNDGVEFVLSSVPALELPAKAVELIDDAKPKDRESVALQIIRYVASARQASIVPVVSSLAARLPGSAAAIALEAGKLVPGEVPGIGQGASGGAPGYSTEISRSMDSLPPGKSKPKEVGPPDKGGDRGNRPETPPGWENSGGTIRGNRPDKPPGHVRDPFPGRDPQRRRYGAP